MQKLVIMTTIQLPNNILVSIKISIVAKLLPHLPAIFSHLPAIFLGISNSACACRN
jgi:hypothetical protein